MEGESQLAFGETLDKRAGPVEKIGAILGYDLFGLGGYAESHFPRSFQELVRNRKIEFPSLSEELKREAQRLYEKEIELLALGLPKAPDAEDYFKASYFLRDPSQAKELGQQEVVDLFAKGEIKDLVFVQEAFQKPEVIEEALRKAGEALNKVRGEISAIVSEHPLFKYLNVPQRRKGDYLSLDPSDKEIIQRLAVLDLHWRNLRDIARTFYMYQRMTEGSLCPTTKDMAVVARWLVEDSQPKKAMRRQAEAVSKEIYGSLNEELWREMLYKYLESYRGKSELDKQIDSLEERFLADMPRKEKEAALKEIKLLQLDKERERWESVESRVARFALAAVKLGREEKLRSLDSRLELRSQFLNLVKDCGLNSGFLQKTLDSFIETEFAKHKDEPSMAAALEATVDDIVGHLKDRNVDFKGFEKLSQRLGEDSSKIKLQDLADIVTVTEADLQEYCSQDSFEGKTGTMEFAKYSRRSSLDMAKFIQDMLTSMRVDSEIVFEESKAKLKAEERKFKIVLTKGGAVSVSTTDFNIKIPISRIFSSLRMAELFGHEIMTHIGGAERVMGSAPGLINSFGSNGPNEGLAKAMETVMREVLENPSLKRIDITSEEGIDEIFRIVKGRQYNLEPNDLFLPFESGNMHIIALGLHLGFGGEHEGRQGTEVDRRNLLEVFKIMKEIYMVEYLHKGYDVSKAEQEAEKNAFTIGVFRQARGLWDGVTFKNMSYAVGELTIREMLQRRENLARLALGKAGPQHRLYQMIFGLNEETIDPKWKIIDRGRLVKNLGLSKILSG